MNVNTKYQGVKDYTEADTLIFKKGLPGFEELTKFLLLQIEDDEFFRILQSVEDEKIGIVVTSPFNIDRNYEIQLSDRLIEELEIEREEDVLVINTVTLNPKLENITVNMRAPIIINIGKNLGEQVILDDGNYLIKHPLILG